MVKRENYPALENAKSKLISLNRVLNCLKIVYMFTDMDNKTFMNYASQIRGKTTAKMLDTLAVPEKV